MKKTITTLALLGLGISLQAAALIEPLPLHRDINATSENAQTRRTEIIYFPTEEQALSKAFEQSPYYLSLNGIWDFKYAPSEESLPGEWSSIKVPGNWERQGWGTPVYVNIGYEFAPDNPQPPVLPEDIPLGIYRRTFSVPQAWDGREVFLNVCGAKSGVYVYLNGKEVGYCEDSKDLARFAIGEYLQEGENELVLKCWRWSTGSWLECQDFWRISGIERDVYLSSEKPLAPEDFRVVSTLDKRYDGTVADGIFSLEIASGAKASYKLIDKDGSVVSEGLAPVKGVRIPGARQWSAETPELYTLLIESQGEYTRFDVGFRRFEIQGNIFYVNGEPVKFKGVNLHEHNEFTGHYLTREELRRHLVLMRSLNINAIRTSHYPQQRAFYELCDSLGFYVYDEANVESHGMGYGERSLAKHPEWYPKHIDRILNMYARTANYPCVTILSLGNEAGNGVNFERAYDVLKELEASGMNRPVVYERAEGGRNTDFLNPMYPKPDWVRAQGVKPSKKPVVLCEYAHAMGNSTGSFDFYWDAFYSYPNLQGGFIWDWMDQGFAETDSKGNKYWTYGGDYADPAKDPARWWSDRNFCCNGLINPDFDIHPGAWEVKYWYQDVQIRFADEEDTLAQNRFILFNRKYFKALNHDLHWEVTEDGQVVASGTRHFDNPDCTGEEFEIDLPEMDPYHSYYVNFDLYSCEEDSLLPADYPVASEQFLLRRADRQVVAPRPYRTRVRETEDRITLKGFGSRLVVNKLTGEVEKYRVRFRNVFLKGQGLRPNFWVAPNDNEWGNNGPVSRYAAWKEEASVLAVSSETDAFGSVVKITYALPYGCSMDVAYNLVKGGALRIDAAFHAGTSHVQVPRIGFRARMNKRYDSFRYFGYGPWENYIDRYAGCRVGEYRSSAKAEFYPYVRPQETGHHIGVEWLEIGPVRISSDYPFQFNALRCSIEDLDPREVQAAAAEGSSASDAPTDWESQESGMLKASGGRIWQHLNDVPVRPWVELCIDNRMTGVGGHDSWGSLTEPVRTVWSDEDYSFSFTLEGK